MKRFFLYFFCTILVFHFVLLLLSQALSVGLRNYYEPELNQFHHLFTDTLKDDFLFLGSSRTHYGVNPSILENLTHKKIYNAGAEGAKIHEMEIILRSYLACHPAPEKIFLMLDPHSLLLTDQGLYNRIFYSQFLNNPTLYEG